MCRRMWSFFRKPEPTAATHCMVQSCPVEIKGFELRRAEKKEDDALHVSVSIPQPYELAEAVKEAVLEFVVTEIRDFCAWAGIDPDRRNHQPGLPDFAWSLMPGFTSIFVYVHSMPPEGREYGGKIDSFLADMSSAFVLGDKGTMMGDQSFAKRGRWTAEYPKART